MGRTQAKSSKTSAPVSNNRQSAARPGRPALQTQRDRVETSPWNTSFVQRAQAVSAAAEAHTARTIPAALTIGLRPAILPKLTVSAAHDPLEREADRIADAVMRMPAQTVRRTCAACAKEDIHRQEQGRRRATDAFAAPPDVARGIQALRGKGRPIGGALRAFFEPRFGRDFGSVRLHTDPSAGRIARQIHARAFTYGTDIAFAPGEYRPGSQDGKKLLAHELAHVVQQGYGTVPVSRRNIVRRDYTVENELIGEITFPKSQKAGGCGICDNHVSTTVGTRAHRAIQEYYFGTKGFKIVGYKYELQVPVPKRRNKRADYFEPGPSSKIAEIKPANKRQARKGVKTVKDYQKLLKSAHPDRKVELLQPDGRIYSTIMPNPKAIEGNKTCEQILYFVTTEPGLIQYWCNPPYSELLAEQCCKREDKDPRKREVLVTEKVAEMLNEVIDRLKKLAKEKQLSPEHFPEAEDVIAAFENIVKEYGPATMFALGPVVIAALLVKAVPGLALASALAISVLLYETAFQETSGGSNSDANKTII